MVALNNERRPVVGISGSNADSASVQAMMSQIRSAGATPLLLSNFSRRDPALDIGKIDALVVMGNDSDIDPERYGQTRHAKTKAESDTAEGKARADYEYAMLKHALDCKMPVMGICGGMQRINVMMGGDLHQDVPELIGHSEHAQQDFGIAPFVPVQPVIIDQKSTLGSIGNGVTAVYTAQHGKSVGIINENSMHHQAVKTAGHGLRVSAYATDRLPDGNLLIEAVEGDPAIVGDQFIMGVQWHPEFGASPLGAKLAERLTQEAAQFASKNNRAHETSQAKEETIQSILDRVKPPATKQGSMVEYILNKRLNLTGQQTSR